MIFILVLVVVLLAALSVTLASVEAAFYLVKRRRLSHLEQNPRAEKVNRYLEDPQMLLMPIHMGTYTAHMVMTVIITMLLTDHFHPWALAGAVGFMILYLLLFRLTLPYSLVWRNPERSLLPAAARLRRLRAGAPPAGRGPAPARHASRPRGHRRRRRDGARARGAPRPRPRSRRGAAGGRGGALRGDPGARRDDAASGHRGPARHRHHRGPAPRAAGDQVQPGAGLPRAPRRHRGRGRACATSWNTRAPPADSLQPLIREAYLVPETKKVAELLKEFQARRITFALAIDEYGGISGLATVEDIVEEIVGEIKDEYDVEAEPISIEPDGAVLVAGRVNVDRLEQALEVSLADGDVGTVGGLVASVFGRIPRPGERMDYRGFTIEIVDAERKRVQRARFRRKPEDVEA